MQQQSPFFRQVNFCLRMFFFCLICMLHAVKLNNNSPEAAGPPRTFQFVMKHIANVRAIDSYRMLRHGKYYYEQAYL